MGDEGRKRGTGDCRRDDVDAAPGIHGPARWRPGGWWTVTVLAALTASAPGAGAQIPDEFQNLRVLPADLPRDSVIEIMRGFSFALSVRCQFCHVGGDGVSFEGVDFASDEDPDKVKARFMLAMTMDINHRLAWLPDRDEPAVEVGCKTCHRGRPRPILLAQELRIALDEFGADSLAATYAWARTRLESGFFDFGEWEVNVLAERLEAEGRPADALAVWEVNLEQHPRSLSILRNVGRLSESLGRTEAAIRAYEQILEVSPDDEAAAARLEALQGR